MGEANATTATELATTVVIRRRRWTVRTTPLPMRMIGVGPVGYIVNFDDRDVLVSTAHGPEMTAAYAARAVSDAARPPHRGTAAMWGRNNGMGG